MDNPGDNNQNPPNLGDKCPSQSVSAFTSEQFAALMVEVNKFLTYLHNNGPTFDEPYWD